MANQALRLSSARLNRRRALGAGAASLFGLGLTGCLGAGPGSPGDKAKGEVTPDNPLGVPSDKPFEAVVFKGGFGDQYIIDAESALTGRFPQIKVKHFGGQELGKLLQPRFISGDVPDLVLNAGAGGLVTSTLVENQQLTDLNPLLDAVALGTPNSTVRNTLRPGTVAIGSYNSVPYLLNYAFVAHGWWYSGSLFQKNGWQPPTTWEQMMNLCAEIKGKLGIAPWTYAGKVPSYMMTPIVMSAIKAGGIDLAKNLDNLVPGAWTSEPMMAAAQAYYQLVERNYIMEGTAGLTNVQSQIYWAQGKAAFIPVASWLESELGDSAPPGLEMKIMSPPAVTTSDAMPVTAIRGAAAEGFLVPSAAKNPWAAMEVLRIMCSPERATAFTAQTKSLTSLAQAKPPADAGSGITSVSEALRASGDNTFYWQFGGWYSTLNRAVAEATGSMMSGQIKPAEWAKRAEEAAQSVRNDSEIKKYTRE